MNGSVKNAAKGSAKGSAGKLKFLPVKLKQLPYSVSGATAVEYGLLAGLIALGIAGGIGALADLVNLIFEMLGETTTEVTNDMPTP